MLNCHRSNTFPLPTQLLTQIELGTINQLCKLINPLIVVTEDRKGKNRHRILES